MDSRRKSPEYYKQRREEGKKKEVPKPWEFIAVDGEGVEERGGQAYALLSSSLHNPIMRQHGLSTEQCLQWLLSLKTKERQQIVSFAFSYDVNKILKDVPYKQLERLYETENCWFEGEEADYHLSWTKGKVFRATEYTSRRFYHSKTQRLRSVCVWDTFGFFQGSFIKAIRDYNIITADNVEEWKVLTEGKTSRGGFRWKDHSKICQYNHLECDLLVKLMENLQNLLRGMGLYLTRWDGAGAIAAALMLKNNVKKHVYQGYSEEVEDALMRSYFGGRSQCVQFGIFEGPIYHYDINSAYPSSYLDLPSLHGKWTTSETYLPNEKYVLYQLQWNIPKTKPITPFPYRDNVGTIRYPHQGRGIYHSILVDVAMEHFSRYITIEKAWVFSPTTDEKPFAWVKPFMEERLRLKREGDLRHITMKLGGNSIYGKTAQGITYGEGLPPYQSYFWAGRITAWAQAQLLSAAMQAPNHTVMFATDAIFSKVPLKLPLGTELGTWEDCNLPQPLSRFELYQPGLYRMIEPDGTISPKTRGFHTEEINFDELAEIWLKEKYNGMHPVEVTRFIGMQLSLAQDRMCDWGDWVTVKKRLRLCPGGWGTAIDPDKNSYTDPGCKQMTYRFQYIDGGKYLSERFTKTDLHLPDPDNDTQMARYKAKEEWFDNSDID